MQWSHLCHWGTSKNHIYEFSLSRNLYAKADSEFVTNENPEYAERITNETASVFIDKVQDIYKIENIKVVDPAKTPTTPSNINHTKDVLKFAGIGLVLGFLVVFFTNFFDTTIKTKEDIEGQFKLHVLATLPKYETAMQKVDKKHARGKE